MTLAKVGHMTNKPAKLLLVIILFFMGLSGIEAQSDLKTPRIGILIREADQSDSDSINGFRAGLKELGYQEGKNILIEVHNARGERGALQSAATELARNKTDLIVTIGSSATAAAMAATKEIPVVFRLLLDPVALGYVKSMERPGGNVTGVAGLSVQQAETRLKIFKEIVPTLRRVHIFYDIYNPISRGHFAIAEVAATRLGLHVAGHPIGNDKELKDSINRFKKQEGDAIYYDSDVLVPSQTEIVFSVARQKKLPTMFGGPAWAARGSLAGYGPNYFEMGRQAASLVDKILKGARPGNLPVERAKKFDLFINLRTASIIGIKVPPEVLSRADNVIR
ncbi:MAG: ABC transporter substrate-binding protein [Nitrospiraceae bacterium]